MFRQQFILLAIVALAVASPIDDKKTPDVSSLPLKKDDPKNSTAKTIDSYTQDGIHATPLHKRDTQRVGSQPVDNNPSWIKNSQQSSTAAPLNSNKSQVPLINNERSSSSNNQKPSSSFNNNSNNKATPTIASAPSVSSQAKTPLTHADSTPPRPLSQSNIQPNLASSSRVRRDAPRPTDQKTSSVNSQHSSTQVKASEVPTQQTKTPTAVPSSVQGSRVNRDTPKPVDTKASPQSTLNSAQKPSAQAAKDNKPIAPSGKAPAYDAKAPAPVAAKSPAVDSTRKTREAPNPHEQSKIVPTSTSAGTQAGQPSKDATHLNPAAVAKSPATTPVHKRESPASNLRGDSQPSSNSNNQSPQFVHPVPVDHILKKQPAGPVTA